MAASPLAPFVLSVNDPVTARLPASMLAFAAEVVRLTLPPTATVPLSVRLPVSETTVRLPVTSASGRSIEAPLTSRLAKLAPPPMAPLNVIVPVASRVRSKPPSIASTVRLLAVRAAFAASVIPLAYDWSPDVVTLALIDTPVLELIETLATFNAALMVAFSTLASTLMATFESKAPVSKEMFSVFPPASPMTLSTSTSAINKGDPPLSTVTPSTRISLLPLTSMETLSVASSPWKVMSRVPVPAVNTELTDSSFRCSRPSAAFAKIPPP